MAIQKVFRAVCVSLTVMIAISAPAAEPSANQWYGDIYDAWKAANTNRRPLVVFFTSDNCRYCHVMRDRTFANAGVQADIRSGFVAAVVNVSDRPALAETFHISRYPTTLIYSSNGQVQDAIYGYADAGSLRRRLRAVAVAEPRDQSLPEDQLSDSR